MCGSPRAASTLRRGWPDQEITCQFHRRYVLQQQPALRLQAQRTLPVRSSMHIPGKRNVRRRGVNVAELALQRRGCGTRKKRRSGAPPACAVMPPTRIQVDALTPLAITSLMSRNAVSGEQFDLPRIQRHAGPALPESRLCQYCRQGLLRAGEGAAA